MHAYVRQRLAARTELADDLVQEVFLAALEGLPSFAGRSSLKAWLLGMPGRPITINNEGGVAVLSGNRQLRIGL